MASAFTAAAEPGALVATVEQQDDEKAGFCFCPDAFLRVRRCCINPSLQRHDIRSRRVGRLQGNKQRSGSVSGQSKSCQVTKRVGVITGNQA